MSEGDVSLIRDEDVLRRMWQQTEDFSKKKEIRTHMYRLREERLRNLYSPESLTADAKGCEFTSAQGHGTSFADQNFQSMKSKEVRDAGSPPKEFTYRGQDLKEYSNAGWNVQSEDSTTDGGATRVKAVHASIEGRYDVDGGAGQFAAADSERRARTVHADDTSSTVRDETSATSASRDHVVRQTPDGTHISKTATSSTSSNYKQVSSTKHDTVPYVIEPENDPSRHTSRPTSHDTNTDERVTRITNRSDNEQSLRTETNRGDLVSRKVEYPDDNTKVIVETRCFPDGTRVTSTRREFRVPAQQTRSEAYHSRNESKSYSSQQKSDTRESTSKTTRHIVESSTNDIVDSQRNVDDHDFKRQIREYITTEDDRSDVRHRDVLRGDRHEVRTDRNVSDFTQKNDYSQTHYETKLDKKITDHSLTKRNEHTQVHHDKNQRYVDNVDEIDRRQEKIIITRDDRIPKTDVKDIHHVKETEEIVRDVRRDTKVEELVEKKTSSDHYQTTYQSDYQQKKVSNDWSPSQQAWASTLRADTPSTTRPSTRASSPASKTFQSSTSSLRSSVSPDKYRKPSSRGGSPNKFDRYSPTRTVTSDRYSSTHSKQSITENRTNKYTSPERKPPSGRSPVRPAYSPERTPHDRQRFSTSPEKRPQSSPTRAKVSAVSPTRPYQSPERDSQSQDPRNKSPSKSNPPQSFKIPSTSPEREVGYRQSPEREEPYSPKRPSASPDRKPGYMRPTAASQHTPDSRTPSNPEDEPDRKSPSKQPSLSPDRKSHKTSKVVEDHYKFVDEETKVHIRNQKFSSDAKTTSPKEDSPRYRSPSPKKHGQKDTDLSPKAKVKSASPQRDSVTITENDELYGRIDKTVEIINTENTKILKTIKGSSPEKTEPRDDSPSKFDTYNKKKTREFLSTDETTIMSPDNSIKTPSDKTSANKVPESSFPTKSSPRDSTSPLKSTTRDTKFKHTTDFISTEKNTEEINKKTVSKDRTRRLTTPSSSPTRKTKLAEPEPSTGQSSPTTSVSGFVYFGSPPREQPMITDLDDNEPNTTNIDQPIYDRPGSLEISVDSLDLRRSSSPSKIPCRSPSPEKRTSPTNETLPRKSSLKKPSAPPADINLESPVEKPPTSFRVSPTEDKPDIISHKIVKKEYPEGVPTNSQVKPKPPLQRRETYEERCRKILGMVDANTTETISKVKIVPKRQDSVQSSPSVSPCDSPAPKETPYPELTEMKTTKTQVSDNITDVTDFITHEIDETVKIAKSENKKSKTPSRESSPTKLQDIISKTTSTLKHETESIDDKTTSRKTDRVIKQDTYDIPKRSNMSPEKKPTDIISKTTSALKHETESIDDKTTSRKTDRVIKQDTYDIPKRSNMSPEKKPTDIISKTTSALKHETESIDDKTTSRKTDRVIKQDTYDIPKRSNMSPEKKPTDIISKTTSALKHETESIDDKTTSRKTDQVIKQDTYDIPKRSNMSPEKKPTAKQTLEPISTPRSSSPTKPSNSTPLKSSVSPSKKPNRDSPVKQGPLEDTYPKGTSPSQRARTSPQKSIYSSNTTTTVTSDTAQDIQETTLVTNTHQRVLKSPVREVPDKTKQPRESPGRYGHTNDLIDEPQRRQSPEKRPSRPRESPVKSPTSTKTFKIITSEYDTSVTEQNKVSKITERKDTTSTSPTRKISQTQPRISYHIKPDSEIRTPKSSPERNTSRQPTEPAQSVPRATSPTRPSDLPGYMRTTTSSSKRDSETTENIQDHTITKKSEKKNIPSSPAVSPTRKTDDKPRTSTPTKTKQSSETYSKKSEKSPERKPHQPQSSSPTRPTDKPPAKSPTRSSPDRIPGYMKSTTTSSSKIETSKHDTIVAEAQNSFSSNVDRDHTTRYTESYARSSSDRSTPDYRAASPSKPTERNDSPNRNRSVSPISRAKESTPQIPSYMRPTESIIHKYESTLVTDSEETLTSKTVRQQSALPKALEPSSHSPTRTSPEKKKDKTSSFNDPSETPADYHPKTRDTPRSSLSPDRKPSYMKPTASVISKYETTTTTEEQQSHDIKFSQTTEQETRQLRTPSPTKKTTNVIDVSSEFILSEKEQEILDKVQKSLRKLSPDRKEKSPSPSSRERSPSKSTTSLQDLDIVTAETVEETHKFIGDNLYKVIEEQVTIKTDVKQPEKLKEQKIPSKPSSRNVSPTKKATTTPSKSEKSPETPNKSRSISPKKTVSSERPHSPQVSRVSGIKPREPMHSLLTRKPTPATLKIDKLPLEVKKTNGVAKQTVTSKTTTPSKISRPISSPISKTPEPETKKTVTSKVIREPLSPKKDTVSRTTSDISIKFKKPSPQRMRSKPEIQINDMSSKSSKIQKPVKETHSKLPAKPKSATALNTSVDEDFIIDVQQSKSSRENSPDRICPTPVNFSDDVSTPRFPDEVSEPDDEYRKRTYHTIHETESVVDDIVEICEDEELFVKKTGNDTILEHDDSIFNVTEKVKKFTNKLDDKKKPTDYTSVFKDTERRVHSDFSDENLKSDECLLSVSEKVNKFAKGPRDVKDNRSPARKITDEYDINTNYTDDYTKLSVNDKAHLFIETAENTKVSKPKPAQKIERPDLSNVHESLKSDECLLSVSDKVNKFVKTAEQFLTETTETEEKERKVKELQERTNKKIVCDKQDAVDEMFSTVTTKTMETNTDQPTEPKLKSITPSKVNDYGLSKAKPAERTPTVKITTLRSSEAVKKAKAMFENIASTQTKDMTVNTTKTTKLTDIGVIKKSPKTDSTTVLHPSVEDVSPYVTDSESEIRTQTPKSSKERPSSGTFTRPHIDDKPRSTPNRLIAQSPEVPRSKSPMRQSVEVTTTKTVMSRYPVGTPAESPTYRPESPRQLEKPDKIPGYLKPTKTSQLKEETKVIEEAEVSSRRGSGKFGVELRRTSVERSTVSSERRRSVDHHQPCIEDIYDLDLLEQMLEKVVGYEQRRRIRSQIRIAKKETEHVDSTNTYTKTTKQTSQLQTSSTPKHRSPERHPRKSPERVAKLAAPKTTSPDRSAKTTGQRTVTDRSQPKSAPFLNGHAKEPTKNASVPRQRPLSPEKSSLKSTIAAKSPVRHPSPEKKRPVSPSKAAPKQKPNRFNEYASAYMKKVGLNEADKVKFSDTKTKTAKGTKQTIKYEKHEDVQEFINTKSFTERTSSKDVIEIVQVNGKRSPSPEKRQSPERKQTTERRVPSPERKAKSPERKAQSPERLYQRTPSPDFKRPRNETGKETIIKTAYDIEKKIPKAQVQEEKPSWVTNRNLKKITSETRTFSSKKIEAEKPKYRPASPSKVITKPIDVITSSYGPGPLDSDGKPLFGIKALRNGASNFQVKGTVIRQEYHSRNGGEPEGSVSVTAYSSQPEELEQLMETQGMEPPSRIHGIAAITTTKKFGGDTGHTYSNVHTKEERASLDQFTHTDRKMENRIENTDTTFETKKETVGDSRRVQSRTEKTRREEQIRGGQKVEERRERIERKEDKKTVRQSSVKSLTEKFIKSANDTGKADRSHYPKAGLILRTTTLRDSISSDDAPGIVRTDSEHSLIDDAFSEHVETTTVRTTHTHGPTRTTTVTVQEPTGTHGKTRTSTVTVQDPTITSHGHTRTSTVTVQEPTVTRQTRSTVIVQEPVVTTVTHGQTRTERSFLDSNTKVTGVQDILTRMKNADIVVQEGESNEDSEARALLNKFLGASVLMAGMQGYVQEQPTGHLRIQETTRSSSGPGTRVISTHTVEEFDVDHCWDERLLRKLLDECTDYEQRRRLRSRIRTLMAEQEACANAVTEALGCVEGSGGDSREEEEITVSSSVRRDSSDKTVSSSTTTKTSKVIESMTRPAPKPVSPFAKFRQLEKQNSTNSPNSPKTPQSPGSPSQPYFKFTDPALHTSALTIKERLLQWCRDKTRDYENVKLENFSTSWADGLAFCALLHHFLPDAFDYSKLTADKRRHNFTLAFKVADEKAGIYPLLDVEDMVAMRKPDWKCVFTYVQSIYRRFKDEN